MPLGSFRLNSLSKFLISGTPGPILGDFGLYKVLDNPNAFGTSELDQFGFSVAVCESYSIVGASNEDDSGGTTSGKAYIYSNSTGTLLYTLNNPNAYSTSANDQFGYAVSICESYAIVGAQSEGDAGGSSSGKAYIFDTSDGSLLYTLNNPNAYSTSAGDTFGRAVSITESYAIVGAFQEDDASGTASGKAYIFDTSDGALLYTLDNPNVFGTSANDYFGLVVGICESYAIVGAQQEETDSGNLQSGVVYIYDTSDGSLLYTIDNPNAYDSKAGDNFGVSVAITESYAIVGAYNEDEAGGAGSGKAYIFDTSNGTLLYTLNNPNAYSTSASDNFGRNVGISESYAIVSAVGEDDAGGSSSGKAYIFDTSDGALLYTLDNPNAYGTSSADQFSYNVGISESYAIVGANQEYDAGSWFSGASGKAYLYSRVEDDHITVSESGLTSPANATSATTTITIPATARAGDIAILSDTSTTTTNTVPSGWTSITGNTTTGIRTNISYKILGSGDPGTSVTGMAGTTRKVMQIFRNLSTPSPTVTIASLNAQGTTSAPSNQTITAGSGTSVYFAAYSKTTATTPTQGFTQTNVTALTNSRTSTSGIFIKYTLFGPGPNAIEHSNATITMTDAGSNVLQSFRMDIS